MLPDGEVSDSSVLIEDGFIRSICPEHVPAEAKRFNFEGKLIMPGLIDLHSDAIEHEVQPRPKSMLPFDLAVRQADRLFATVGVSTAYHSLSFWSDRDAVRSNQFVSDFSRAISRLSGKAIIDNRVHARFEITNAEGLVHLESLFAEGVISLASVMDHTPGQGQYPNEEAFRNYCEGTGMANADIDALLHNKQEASRKSWPSVLAFTKAAQEASVPLASHDDDQPDRVFELNKLGVTIAEFPMNLEAADAAINLGYTVLVGAPNVMRGQSTGSGPRAIELIEKGQANALCSDYMPATILPAIFKVAEELDWPLWKAVRLSTAQPAIGAELLDRGEIVVGKRADLIVVELHHNWPIVRYLWSQGHLSYASMPFESATFEPADQ